MLNFSRWKIFFIVVICLISAVAALPSFISKEGRNELPSFLPNKNINLGLDLQGGSQLLIEVDFNNYLKDQLQMMQDAIRKELRTNKIGYSNLKVSGNKLFFSLRDEEDADKMKSIIKNFNKDLDLDNEQEKGYSLSFSEQALKSLHDTVISQSIEIIRRRVDETGTKEPSIQKQGENYILLQVPGLDDPEHLKSLLGKTAKLTFHLVDESANLEEALSGHVPPGSIVLSMDGAEGEGMYAVLKKKVILSGDQLNNAIARLSQEDKASVNIDFNKIGAKLFGETTKENVGRYLAIVLDNKVISIARITEPILGGQCQISGNFTATAANDLALLLRAGSLLAPLKIIEERTVGPNLGSDSIEAGKNASIVSLIMIMIFMLLVYGIPGIFANVALLINLVIITAALSLLQATLTMPGIAGIILTMGMAVDANVLIFERIREELRSGMSPLAATDRGFKQAFTTILDSNITTILVAILLYCFGSGVVKGFAVTLTIGITSSMFSAITLTRLMMATWLKISKNARILL
jgi:preprotein translocase subunit SecD